MTLSLLWTDKCFFLVLVVIAGVLCNGLRSVPTRQAFLRILSKPIPVSAGVVLMFFLMIGILDSIHFAPNSRSVLDNLLAPIGDVYEQSYSEPMALTLYSSEVVVDKGATLVIHPPLEHIKSTLQTEKQKHQFIQVALINASEVSFLIVLLVGVIVMWSRRSLSFNRVLLSFFLTLFIAVLLVSASYLLSRGLHLLGTGKIGQDIFYAAVKSIRTGLIIGILTTLFMMPLALLLGIAAGYFGGIIDDVIQYVYTTLSSIPGVLLITASVLSMQTYIANHPEQFTTLEENADARLLALCFILGITSWTSLCRLLRAETLKLKEVDYVLAAKALGTSAINIIFKHLLPNVMHIVIITFVLDFSFLVLAEAVLSYVGVGVSPLTISWGNMINAARLELARDPVVWWPMLAAFMFMFALVLASNLFADAVEDAFNPKTH